MPRDTHAEAELLAEATPLTPRQQFEQARTLHEILRMAIDDFEAVLDDPRYVVCFGSWHGPISARWAEHHGLAGKQSAVCFAGAVMAKRLGAEIDWNIGPERFEDAQGRLQSLCRRQRSRSPSAAIHKRPKPRIRSHGLPSWAAISVC